MDIWYNNAKYQISYYLQYLMHHEWFPTRILHDTSKMLIPDLLKASCGGIRRAVPWLLLFLGTKRYTVI